MGRQGALGVLARRKGIPALTPSAPLPLHRGQTSYSCVRGEGEVARSPRSRLPLRQEAQAGT